MNNKTVKLVSGVLVGVVSVDMATKKIKADPHTHSENVTHDTRVDLTVYSRGSDYYAGSSLGVPWVYPAIDDGTGIEII